MGDFTDFTFNGYHSFDNLGILRVSDGDRYDENILPDFEDKVVDIPGGDGSYYYGSYFQPKQFSIKIAFDHLTEKQYRDLRRVFSTRLPKPLFFDEAPYKVYYAKLSSPIELNTVCFDERKLVYEANPDPEWEDEDVAHYLPGSVNHPVRSEETGERIYKGEGTIELIAYKPFGYIRFKDLDSYGDLIYIAYNIQSEDNPSELGLYIKSNNEYILTKDTKPQDNVTYYQQKDYNDINEWAETAGLKTAAELKEYDSYNNGQIKLYNPGDLSAPFKLYVPFPSNGNVINEITIGLEGINGAQLKLDTITRKDDGLTPKTDDPASGILINTNNCLIEGVTYDSNTETYTTTGYIYNDKIKEGNFFKIPTSNSLDTYDDIIMNITGGVDGIKIIYDYLYF